ncbi:MAG: hypothetical protein AVDCRST_MAG02-4796, partial [uncultured Rubrobacteraceae bacterium]
GKFGRGCVVGRGHRWARQVLPDGQLRGRRPHLHDHLLRRRRRRATQPRVARPGAPPGPPEDRPDALPPVV